MGTPPALPGGGRWYLDTLLVSMMDAQSASMPTRRTQAEMRRKKRMMMVTARVTRSQEWSLGGGKRRQQRRDPGGGGYIQPLIPFSPLGLAGAAAEDAVEQRGEAVKSHRDGDTGDEIAQGEVAESLGHQRGPVPAHAAVEDAPTAELPLQPGSNERKMMVTPSPPHSIHREPGAAAAGQTGEVSWRHGEEEARAPADSCTHMGRLQPWDGQSGGSTTPFVPHSNR